MTKPQPHSAAEIEAFAERCSLTNLTKDHLARMQGLAPIATELGRNLPRPKHKSDAPAPCFTVAPIIKI